MCLVTSIGAWCCLAQKPSKNILGRLAGFKMAWMGLFYGFSHGSNFWLFYSLGVIYMLGQWAPFGMLFLHKTGSISCDIAGGIMGF